MKIKHLKQEEIDRALWDEAVSRSRNGMTYACSWFLDCVSPEWEALVEENFRFIMPLPVKKKFGLKYLVQPVLTQQLGIFSPFPITEDVVRAFIRSIPYWSYEMNLNEDNYVETSTKHPNLLLNLSVGYERLSEKFSVNTLRNIKKAEKHHLQIAWELTPADFIRFYFHEEKTYALPDKNKTKNLVINAVEKGKINLLGVKTAEGKLIAALGLLTSGARLIYLLPTSTAEGKEKSAMFFLVNEVIKKYAASDKTLDFEGSKIEGVARFYEGFGAKRVSYYSIKRFRPAFLTAKR